MDLGRITPEYVYRMWGGTVQLDEIETGLKAIGRIGCFMNQGEIWQRKYREVIAFIETNKRNPSRYDPEERGRYCNWIKHNKNFLMLGR